MKVTRLNGDFSSHKVVSLASVVKEMCREKPLRVVQDFRDFYHYLTPESSPADTNKIPAVIFSSLYKGEVWMQYTGLVLIEFNRLSSANEAVRIKQEIIRYKNPLLCFIGVSGRSVKVLVRFTLPDGSLPENQEDARRFHAHAFLRTAMNYQD